MTPPRRRPGNAARPRRAGFSLVEAILVMAIVSVAATMYAQTVASSARLDPIAAETATAAEAARIAIEELRAQPIDQVVALFDADPDNDPGGPGTAPGARFGVAGLAPVAMGEFVGVYEFPAVDGRIAEDLNDEMLGCPRDLNADGLVDAADHRDDWVILPVRVRLEWMPRGGSARPRTFELFTMLARL
jgi:prepilin-type N-terminal cleavage/methylation domain-containing protein